MPGPLPKDPAIRERRNKSSSQAILPAWVGRRLETPKLPDLPGKKKWHPMAALFWETVWSSPMIGQYIHADEFSLYRLTFLYDCLFKARAAANKLAYAREIRMLERDFGLTPLSRRRLEWTVAAAEEAADQHEHKRIRRAAVIDGQAADPRGALE